MCIEDATEAAGFVSALIEAGADVDAVTSGSDRCCCLSAAKRADVDSGRFLAVPLLLAAGAESPMNKGAASRPTRLQYAIDALLKCGADDADAGLSPASRASLMAVAR